MTDINFLPSKEATDYPLPLSEIFKEVISSLRRQVLSQFVGDLALALEQEGYQFDELLDCFADFAQTRPDLKPVVKDLESAREKLLTARRAGVGEPPSE